MPSPMLLAPALLAALLLAAPALAPMPVGRPAAAAGDAGRGEQLFQSRCGVCHSLDVNRTGPRLGGVVGRPAGSVPGFAYSKAVAGAGFAWTEALLERWLTDPQALLPGQKMNIRVQQPADRADLIAFLKSRS
jgi:cytochrome c